MVGAEAFKQKWLKGYMPVRETLPVIRRILRRRPEATPLAALPEAFSARSGPSPVQIFLILLAVISLVWVATHAMSGLMAGIYWFFWLSFSTGAGLRFLATLTPKREAVPDTFLEASNENLPRYSVIVALYREAAITSQLVKALSQLDYPRENLEVLYALEADDFETIAAFKAQDLPDYMHIVLVPPGTPRTKPRALNYALARAQGDLVVIYDAEDRPAPDQLIEAARTFARAQQTGDMSLACLQAPLRPLGGDGFIARQFAAEYAVQFDVLLPAFCRLKLPFPLGGTSNHFRTKVLKSIGAWDAYNVTEDADLGLRLAQYGYTSTMLKAPTIETPPSNIYTWIPQRTRWIKGYMQTLIVHSRLNTALRLKVWISMILGVGLSTLAALCYAPFTCFVLSGLMLQALSGQFTPMAYRDAGLLLFGTLSGMLALYQGARRAGVPFGLKDVLSAPAYWSLQSISAAHAIYQLIVKPFHWDKTDHKPAAIS
ncbi:glycosyltransferase family 2 protein [Asticcacaulis endophyticus]|uniref:Glycosyltransferase 2-like domain-containing protein n=1 Tax=Asticcacaulis endophyticus TaxID=1395890 RepID=A0A918QB94_9CAUL|nr:glycosyltransferase family 2 protein [Asticcacaulis endophyticus]GGZ40685.1 hypothetical protein GCM10011273_29260 [Asticcacaulis endophyticus]